jgi:enhancing lycopene biosynthesis protein 2
MQRFAINIMKAIHDNCPHLDVTNDLDTADFFLRMDRDAVFGPAKMAIFDRTRTMVFVASTHSISKDVKRFAGCW